MTARQAELDAFSDALRASGSVRIVKAEILRLWAGAAPRLAGAPNQLAELYTTLRALDDAGVIELPKGAWDRSTIPPLPKSIAIPASRRPASARGWVSYPWRTELGWVASIPSLSEERFTDLVAINTWLGGLNGTEPAFIPIRYRSAEIFGVEKRIENMARTQLFGPARLTLDLLRCRRLPTPLTAGVVGTGPDVLVVENSDTYWVATEEAHRAAGRIGRIVFGYGAAFPTQVEALGVDVAGGGPVTGTVWYWGDLDPKGLTIAADADQAARVAGVGPVRPAQALWAAMAHRPIQDAGSLTWTEVPRWRAWLGDDLWASLVGVRDAGGRVAQEAIPAEHLGSWLADPDR